MTKPADVAHKLRSLGGVLDEAARDIDHNGDLLSIDWGDVDGWITDLQEIQSAIDADGREDDNTTDRPEA